MNDSKSGSDGPKAMERRESMTQRSQVQAALEKAIRQAAQRSTQSEAVRAQGPTSKADAAIKKLREDQRLTREELDRPVTI